MQEKLIRYFPAVIMRMSPYQRRKRTKNQQIGTAWKEPPGLAEHVAGNATTIVDSLFLDQYRETPQKISQAIAMCMEHSAGCMLFDLSYLVKDNWWKYANAVEYSQMKPGDQADVAEICKEIFAPEYFVTPEKTAESSV